MNGFRFISSKAPSIVSFRAEIWFDFSNEDSEILFQYKKIFEDMFTEVGFEHSEKTIRFINMKGEPKDEKQDTKPK